MMIIFDQARVWTTMVDCEIRTLHGTGEMGKDVGAVGLTFDK